MSKSVYLWAVSLTILFKFLPTIVLAQIDYTNVYYPIINKAELAIIENNYKEALTYYQQSFNNITPRKPFAKDYYNALICALNIQEYEKAFYYTEELILKGYNLEDFSDEVIKKLKTRRKNWKMFELAYPNLREKFESRVNHDYIKVLNDLQTRFKNFTNRKDAYTNYNDTIYNIHEANIKEFKLLIKKYGFPTEDLLGLKDSLHNYSYWDILFHDFNTKKDRLSDLLLQAVKRGDFPVKFFTLLQDRLHRSDAHPAYYGHYTFIRFNSTVIQMPINLDILRNININRMRLGLENINDYRKKILFQFSNPKYKLLQAHYSVFNVKGGDKSWEKTQINSYTRLGGKIVYIFQKSQD